MDKARPLEMAHRHPGGGELCGVGVAPSSRSGSNCAVATTAGGAPVTSLPSMASDASAAVPERDQSLNASNAVPSATPCAERSRA